MMRCATARPGVAMLMLVLTGACDPGQEPGPPVRLLAGAADTLVVNNRRPVPIPIRALDVAGRAVPATGVRYAWMAGDSLDVTADGMVTCRRRGDATLRASLHAVAITTLVLRCRPVERLHIAGPMQFVLGDSSQPIPLEALDTHGMPVDLLAGTVSEQRGGVFAVERGLRVRPRMAGASLTTVVVGDEHARVGVHVYEPASGLDGLRNGQELVAVSMRLASGEVRQWQLPAGGWMLTMMPYEDEASGLRLRVEGAACKPLAITRRRIACAVQQDASVIVYHPSTTTAPDLTGRLLVRRANF
jgi:hypothetical protein